MTLAAALIYWVILALWITVLGAVLYFYARNPRIFGMARLLLLVIAIDTIRNIIENTYFGLFFGSQYGIFPASIGAVLGNPALLIIPKVINVVAACLVLWLLLIGWLPKAVQERHFAEQRANDLGTLATIDGLTSVFNRRRFDELAHAEWLRYQRYMRPLSLLILDIDNFKSINDRFGHAAGDNVLIAMGKICNSAKRKTDVLARVGGEEFALLLPETDEAAATIFAERLRQEIEDHLHLIDGERVRVTVSIGMASATQSMSGFEALRKRADDALYAAKRGGRNRVVVAEEKETGILQLASG